MCCIFGFRSVVESQLHRSLVEADNAILHQSNVHPDGWGVAYYVAGSPHLIKSVATAVEDRLFQKVSGIVASETVVAHLRKATVGELCITNAHPFQYGRWIFAHNGNIEGFEHHRQRFLAEISPKISRYILGNTDSEVLFYLLLTKLAARVDLHRPGCGLDDLAWAVGETIAAVVRIAGPWHPHDDGPPDKTYLTFILTDGASMIAHQGGKALYYSTYKTRCGERNSCPHFAAECESRSTSGYVNHLILSSEPIIGENIWIDIAPGNMIGVDWSMRLKSFAACAV